MNDPFGEAIRDYFEKGKAPDLIVNSNYTEGEEIAASWFFRTEKEMPAVERAALKRCNGKVLDIGAAAGCHSLLLQKKGFNVTALEKSEKAAEVMKKRGIQKVVCGDIYQFSENQFDTILLLMNGVGIGETVAGLEKLLAHIKTLLTEKGQILIDSTDIKYLFKEEDGSLWIDLANKSYYGEMEYEVKYKKSVSKFKWLFIDFEKLKKVAKKAGLDCILIESGKNHDFLA
jgi:SAM-dependent methyltransferase